jgi:alanine dehydrogenase
MAHNPVQLLCISGADVLRLVDPMQAIDALAEGFKALSRGEVQAPGRPKVEFPGKGFTMTMLAGAPGRNIATKVVSVFEGNHKIGLASHQAIVALFDCETGVPVAIMDGASLTGLRTAAAAILSVRELARTDARVATVVGGGVQGREHVRQLGLVRPFDEIRVYARQPSMAEEIAATIPKARAVTDLRAAVATSDVVCLTTAAATPVIEDGWIRPGTHVASVGYAPPGSEVPAGLIGRARLFVEAVSAFEPAPVGCAELAGMDASRGAELGQVLLGTRPGRTSPEEITLYKSMGNAMEDMVVANLVWEAARKARVGVTVTL